MGNNKILFISLLIWIAASGALPSAESAEAGFQKGKFLNSVAAAPSLSSCGTAKKILFSASAGVNRADDFGFTEEEMQRWLFAGFSDEIIDHRAQNSFLFDGPAGPDGTVGEVCVLSVELAALSKGNKTVQIMVGPSASKANAELTGCLKDNAAGGCIFSFTHKESFAFSMMDTKKAMAGVTPEVFQEIFYLSGQKIARELMPILKGRAL